jgi:hypothetical protein
VDFDSERVSVIVEDCCVSLRGPRSVSHSPIGLSGSPRIMRLLMANVMVCLM